MQDSHVISHMQIADACSAQSAAFNRSRGVLIFLALLRVHGSVDVKQRVLRTPGHAAVAVPAEEPVSDFLQSFRGDLQRRIASAVRLLSNQLRSAESLSGNGCHPRHAAIRAEAD